ncbi:copper chaperone PCu(A)C [Pseudomonas defluvii]|uniref:copper chaperone PCu(A)C n=1 Tax=Pseudomonas defluvii TaxID=1876757 RepID=UPI003906C025
MKNFPAIGLCKANHLVFGLLLACLSAAALAEVKVEDAWVRAAVPGQSATGAFMRITASTDSKLIAASSPIAGNVELHAMHMKGDVMSMVRVGSIELPAGKTVSLDSHGYHIMLFNPKLPIEAGATVPLTLTVVDDDGTQTSIKVDAPVRPLASGESDLPH